jgi:hypothetical protein
MTMRYLDADKEAMRKLVDFFWMEERGMTINKKTLAIIVLLPLGGCLNTAYDHASATQQEFLQARHECMKDSKTGFSVKNGTGKSCVTGFPQCLAAKGYTKNRGSGRLKVPGGQGVKSCN